MINLSSSPNPVDDDSQQSSTSSLPVDTSNNENLSLPTLPLLLLSDSETLDEGFETQSNVSETVEPTSRSCPIETISNETKSSPIDEKLAEELTQRLTFNSTRRLSHDSNIRNINNKRAGFSNGRSISLLKTSTSAYSYPTFTSIGQQNSPNNTFTKRTPSVESLRLTSPNNNTTALAIRASRHIQRCAVSRRIWNEKETDDTSKNLNPTSPPPPQPPPPPISTEPDEVSSSSTATTTTTTVTNTKANTTTTATNRHLSTTKSKNKIRNLNSLNDSSSRSNSPIIRKTPSHLSHASSCQNVSTASNSSKSSPLTTKARSPPSFFLNSSQLLRSSFTRPTDKPLRALPLSTTINNETTTTSSSPRTRRLFSSNNDINLTSTSSPKTSRKPPSSWHHQKSLPAKTSPLTTVLHSSNLTTNRKTSSSTNDLRKTNPMNNTFQRITQSKRL